MNANPQLARTRTPAPAGIPTQESALRNDVSVSDRVADAVSDARSDSEVSGLLSKVMSYIGNTSKTII